MGAAVLADRVVAVVPGGQAVQGGAQALVDLADLAPGEVAVRVVPVAQAGQVLEADLGEMVSVDHMATAPRGPSAMATADLRVRRETVSAEVLANGPRDRVARHAMPNADLTATGQADLLVREASDLRAQKETASDDPMVIDPRVRHVMANEDPLATGRVARQLAGNGPSGSVE